MKTKIKILIVDDDVDVLAIIRYCFTNTPQIDLLCASSGEEAIKIALETNPDMILLDVMMPKMDGIATLRALSLIPKFVKTCIIFLTAKSQKHEIEEYLQMGVFDVIAKPFDPLTLSSKVLDLYDRYQKK